MIKPNALICVDHEGGRVQRFGAPFTRIPSAGSIGKCYDHNPLQAEQLAYQCGWMMASELLALDIDFSFAPVVDCDRGISAVIGNRAFHQQEAIVITLAREYMKGMQAAGMATVIKHFPGHGSVSADSHLALPHDPRSYKAIAASDLQTFAALAKQATAVMPAHIVFPEVDDRAVGYSRAWLQDVLRDRLGFQGIVISDDLTMIGATTIGDITTRAEAAYQAGCDLLLVCNDRPAVQTLLQQSWPEVSPQVIARLRHRGKYDFATLQVNPMWRRYQEQLDQFTADAVPHG